MENEKIVTRVNTVWLGADGNARIIHVPGAQVTAEDAGKTMAAFLKLNKGKRRPLLVDTKTIRWIAREARRYYASEQAAKVASAVGLIVESPVSNVLGNFYLGLSRPHLSSQLFTSEARALQWLQGYLE